MSSKQNTIFQEGSGERADPRKIPGKHFANRWIWNPIKQIFRSIKAGAVLAAAFMFVWGMSEQFLPEDYRLSRFLAFRVINFENLKNRGTAFVETKKQEAISAAQASVDLIKTCEANRTSNGQNVFTTCMSHPRSLITGCEFQRDMAMQATDCSRFKPEQLAPATFPHLQTKGVLP